MQRANMHFAQCAVFSVAYGSALERDAGSKGVNSLHLVDSDLPAQRTKSMGARLRDVGKLKFKPQPERFSDI
jgi:hypothetical protein